MPNRVGNFSVYTYNEMRPKVFSLQKNHLLLGNGFSSSLFRHLFSYSALRSQLDANQFSIGTRIQNIFTHIRSDDFEEVIQKLTAAEPLATEYGLAAGPMSADCNALKNELIAAIGSNHPAHPWN